MQLLKTHFKFEMLVLKTILVWGKKLLQKFKLAKILQSNLVLYIVERLQQHKLQKHLQKV